mgnify:CR=1 FL=1
MQLRNTGRIRHSQQAMSIRRVLVLEGQVPFVHGGAEILVRELVKAFQAGGYEAELVSVPFKDYPREEILTQAALWRLIDLSSAAGRPGTGSDRPWRTRCSTAQKTR